MDWNNFYLSIIFIFQQHSVEILVNNREIDEFKRELLRKDEKIRDLRHSRSDSCSRGGDEEEKVCLLYTSAAADE